jgi:hypothetical protein
MARIIVPSLSRTGEAIARVRSGPDEAVQKKRTRKVTLPEALR